VSRVASAAASAGLGAAFAAVAFVAEGGQILGSATAVEVALILGCGLLAAAAIVWGRAGSLSGAVTLALFGLLAVLTALSVTWSIQPDASWIEANRTLAYLAVFAAAIGAARLAPNGWVVLLRGLLIGIAVVAGYALASRIWPADIAPNDLYSRLAQPYGYWNALGLTAALGVPLTLWLGSRRAGNAAANALAYPLLSGLLIAIFLSFSRGAIIAAAVGAILWLAIVPLRLRSVTVLAVSAAGAAPLLLWALTKKAFTESSVPLPLREQVADDFGILLLTLLLLTLAAGLTVGFRITREAPSPRARLRVGATATAVALIAPIVMFAAVETSDKGISDRVSSLADTKGETPGGPGRFATGSSSRAKYWREAGLVFEQEPALGTGAGTFGTARLRFRRDALVARQAHGYVAQTISDLGAVGLALSLALLTAWAIAVARALGVRRHRDRSAQDRAQWTPERVGLAALACCAVVFGVQSVIDWTWFVPGPAVMALAAAGFVAGSARSERRWAARPSLRPLPWPRIAMAAAALLMVGVCAWAAWQPQRSHAESQRAYDLLDANKPDAADAAARNAEDINPLALEPLFARSAVLERKGDLNGAEAQLREGVREHRSDPASWLRLAQFQLFTLDEPARAQKTLLGAIALDPNSREAAYAYFETRNRLRGGKAAPGQTAQTAAPAPAP
jgi:tetratricopeptide (TPR) repeat protein